tara:strand:- start:254 stop:529 length:276 start_codon:yes stop_codon:yes gene_type:complete
MTNEPGKTAVNATYNAGYGTGHEEGYELGRHVGRKEGFELGRYHGRKDQEYERAAAISAIETRIQQLEQYDERVATVELEWVLQLLGDAES